MNDYGANNNADNNKPNNSKTKEWIYGILFPFPAKIIMKAIYEVLNQMNTVNFFFFCLLFLKHKMYFQDDQH